MNYKKYLDQTLELAKKSAHRGDHPFGAVVVLDGDVVATSENFAVTHNDVTTHAELLLVSKVSKSLTGEQRRRAILCTSTEPCAMCAGAIYWAEIPTVVYGCSMLELYKIVTGGLFVRANAIVREVIEMQSLKFIQVHKDFWLK